MPDPSPFLSKDPTYFFVCLMMLLGFGLLCLITRRDPD